MNRFRIPLIVAALVLSAATGGWIVQSRTDDDLFELKKNFEIFGSLYQEIILNYVDDVRPGPFMRAGVDGMLSRLDPYTQYYDQADNVDSDVLRQRSVGDVGLNIGVRDGTITVLAPETDARAYQRGVRVGDIVRRVDGVDVSGWTVRDVAVLLRGDEGTTVTIDVDRPGEPASLSFILQRSITRSSNVAYSGYLGGDSTDGVAYVRLDVFGNRAAREVRRALRELSRDSELRAIVLDLRNNPGGILSEAIETVGLFVPRGTDIVSTRGRIDDITKTYSSEDDPFFLDVPVVVLVNEISASASEIVAGAIQDLDRGVVVGQTTYGKGLVQVIRPLPYNTSMKITIGHYNTPSGRDIQSRRIASTAADVTSPDIQIFSTAGGRPVRSGVGVEPDVVIPEPRVSELESALERQGAFFRYAGVFADEHPSESVDALALDDASLTPGFENWLERIGFEYESSAEILLDSLFSSISTLDYAGAARPVRDARTAIAEEKNQDIERYRAAIGTRLREEILSRYVDEAERIRISLETDAVALRALDLVQSPSDYNRVLGK